jgi:N-methylhydantoinase B
MENKTTNNIDLVTRELIKNSLSSIIDEMALTMCHTAYSSVIRDIFDFCTGLTDHKGETIAEGLTNPSMSGVIPFVVRAVLENFKDDINPGDIFICNDPYGGATHLPDIYLVKPIFIDGQLVAFSGADAHELDVGGRVPGSNACDNIDIYSEGLRMPPLKYYDRGVRNTTLYKIMEKNFRVSHLVLGDIEAKVAAVSIGDRHLQEMAKKFGGWTVVRRYIDDLMDYSERMTRAAIKALPSGVYEFEDCMDDNGFTDDPIVFHCKIIIEDDNLTMDFTGTSPVTQGSMWLPYSSAYAMALCGIRLVMDPKVPANAGVYRAVKIIAPYGTAINASFPAGVAGRGATLGRLFDAIQGAMAQIAPDRVNASSCGVDFGICTGGKNEDGEQFVFTDFLMGSWGGRPWGDGLDATTSFWANYSNTPCEVIESEKPFRIESYTFIPDTGGAGKYRGGLSIIKQYRCLVDNVTCQFRIDRQRFPPYGLYGGKPGALAKAYLTTTDGKVRSLKKEIFTLNKGDLITCIVPGAGGYGNPYERDPQKVLTDVTKEVVSIEKAKDDYGVVIDPKTLKIDMEATQKIRQKLAGKESH